MQEQRPQRLTRKEKRQKQNNKRENAPAKLNFNLKQVEPMTKNQRLTFEAYSKNKHLMLHGIAGTGKSYISMYLALEQVLKDDSLYKKLYIVRSVVPTRDMGFLPGSNKEKTKVYEAPYYSIAQELFGRGDSYEYLKQKQFVEFISTSFIRGITLNDCIVLVDEMQNMDWGELSSVMTRIGKNCRIIFCGDYRQTDFRFKERESRNDINKFIRVLRTMPDFQFIDFQVEDIVRSDIVKKFIVACDHQGVNL